MLTISTILPSLSDERLTYCSFNSPKSLSTLALSRLISQKSDLSCQGGQGLEPKLDRSQALGALDFGGHRFGGRKITGMPFVCSLVSNSASAFAIHDRHHAVSKIQSGCSVALNDANAILGSTTSSPQNVQTHGGDTANLPRHQ